LQYLALQIFTMKYYSCLLIAAAALCSCGDSINEPSEPVTAPQDSIIFKDAQGNVLTLADIESFTGKAEYEITDDIKVDPRAQLLHEEGRRLGGEGKYDESIAKLKEAMAVQPQWAYPPYDLAYTYSLKGDDASALKYYELTDSLRPNGFFTCKTALWSLRAERDGKFPAGTYMTFMMIEWSETEQEKIQIAKAIVDSLPAYAPAWMELAHLLDDNAERMTAIENGLSSDPDPETKGILLLNKAGVLKAQGHHAEAVTTLGNMIFDPETTGSNRQLAETTLKSYF
jgi:tetratricopeptide (TPR) repeat protein